MYTCPHFFTSLCQTGDPWSCLLSRGQAYEQYKRVGPVATTQKVPHTASQKGVINTHEPLRDRGPKYTLVVHGRLETSSPNLYVPARTPQFPSVCFNTHRALPFSSDIDEDGGSVVVKPGSQLDAGDSRSACDGEHPRSPSGGRRTLLVIGSVPGCKQFVSRRPRSLRKEQVRSRMRSTEGRPQSSSRTALHGSAQHAVRPAGSRGRKASYKFIIVTIHRGPQGI